MLEAAYQLAGQGVAVHWLRPRSKAPLADQWSSAPVATPEDLRSSYREGLNLGIRLGKHSKVGGGFLLAIDLDIRDASKADEAWAQLRKIVPGVDLWPFVISGSGGESRHFYSYTDRPFRSRKLAHSSTKFVGKDGKEHWSWEIELFGTGKQVAAPPSIHPDTGKEYVWGRRIPFDEIDMGFGPFVAAAVVMGWGVNPDDGQDDDDDGLTAEVHRRPLGLKDAEIQEILDDLPHDQYCDDREGWLNVGMALHHEFEGSDRGLDVWKAFSAKSEKYDAKDIRRVWESFRGRLKPVRMPTLIKAAGMARLERDHDEVDDAFDDLAEKPTVYDPEIEDLLGTPTPKPESTDDIDNIGSAPPNDNKEWRRLLDRNEDGNLKNTLHNLILIVRNDVRTKGLPNYNIFRQRVVQRTKPGHMRRKGAKPTVQLTGDVWKVEDAVNGDAWPDSKDNGLRAMIEAPLTQGGWGIKVTDRDLKAAIDIVANEHSYHPVREYLDGLKWDGQERVETLFIRYFGVKDNSYARMTARLAMIAAVTRANEPGHKFDFVVIFEGFQGKGKSTFIKILARNWFAELHGNYADRKSMIEKMQGHWILELGELSGFDRVQIEDVKAFVSATVDTDRLAWDRRASDFKRQCIFFGSTNKREYLRDEENRRFWPLPCTVTEIDTDALEAEVDQLWAEATVMYRKMREEQPHGTLPLFLKGQAAVEARAMQDSRRTESAEEAMAGQIESWLGEPKRDSSGFDEEDDLIGGPVIRDRVCLLEVWAECLGRDRALYKGAEAQLIGRAMNMVQGWVYEGQHRFPAPYGKQRAWKRKEQ